MGAHSFQEISRNADVKAAYADLVASAAFEGGHSAYSGTIATTNGYRVTTDTVITRAHADALMRERLEHLSKWDACEAVRIGVPAKTKRRSVTVKGIAHVAGATDLAAALGVDISQIVSYTVTARTSKHALDIVPAAGAKVWVWENKWCRTAEFATKAEALKAMKAALASEGCHDEVAKHQLYQRSAKTNVVATLTEVRTTADVELAVGPLTFDAWLFYGWAAS